MRFYVYFEREGHHPTYFLSTNERSTAQEAAFGLRADFGVKAFIRQNGKIIEEYNGPE